MNRLIPLLLAALSLASFTACAHGSDDAFQQDTEPALPADNPDGVVIIAVPVPEPDEGSPEDAQTMTGLVCGDDKLTGDFYIPRIAVIGLGVCAELAPILAAQLPFGSVEIVPLAADMAEVRPTDRSSASQLLAIDRRHCALEAAVETRKDSVRGTTRTTMTWRSGGLAIRHVLRVPAAGGAPGFACEVAVSARATQL